jgi:Ser/Thr protein kinase RdoA (MazF antagonist)
LIVEHLDGIEAAEAFGATFDGDAPVGSHRDLNAHNVLFTRDGPRLIDWDSAGPESAVYERASTATLWAQRHDGLLELDVAAAFLRGYQEGGGTVRALDTAALPRWLTGLSWWTERNVQISLTQPTRKHDELATYLVGALISGVETVKRRQRFLHDVIARL